MHIEHISDLLPAIKGRPEFVVIDRGSYTAIDYLYQDETSFDDPRRLECRGIKFDADGRLIARPFRKFFNVGEKEQPQAINLARPHVVLDKLDGSMIHPAMIDGNLVLMTRKGHTDVAKKAEARFLWRGNYTDLMLRLLCDGLMPIFEYTGPENRIVVRYEMSAMTLLAVREIHSGTYMSYRDTAAIAHRHEVPHVGVLDLMPSVSDMAAFIAHTRDLQDAEGYVIRFADGHMLKMKGDDYLKRHRALDDFASKKKVAALVLQGFQDDIMPMLDPTDASELRVFATEVNAQVSAAAITVRETVLAHKDLDRKQFALEIAPQYPDWQRAALFKHLDGTDPDPVIRQMLGKRPELIDARWRGE